MAKHLHNKRPQQARQGCYKTRLLQLDESRSRSSTPSPKHCAGLASSHLHPSRKNRPQCLRGNKAPRGRPPSPTRRRAQSPSQNPAGLGFSPAQLLQCAEFQCGSFPLLASGLDRQTDRRTDRQTDGRWGGRLCRASAQPPRDWGLQGEGAGQSQAWCPHKVPPCSSGGSSGAQGVFQDRDRSSLLLP